MAITPEAVAWWNLLHSTLQASPTRGMDTRLLSGIGVSLIAGVAVALASAPVCRWLARRVGAMSHPSPDRWCKQSTALFGGIAVVVASAAGLFTANVLIGSEWADRFRPWTFGPATGVVVSGGLMFLVGLADDVVRLRPQAKFLFQLVAGVLLISSGALLPVTHSYVVNVVATLFLFVALTNAFNLLDGLDGVAAGVGAIAAFFLGITFAQRGAWWHAAMAWSLAGAALGFLRYNVHPASIFLGDAGSLFIGSLLAGLVASAPEAASASLVSVLFVPLAIVAVPLLDTSLVTMTRVLAGRPISVGGLDHSTYRLIALGLTEGQVAMLLSGFALAGGLVALFLMWLDHGLGLVIGTIFLVAMSLLAAYLGRIQIAEPGDMRRLKRGTVLVRTLIYRRRLAEILLDAVLVTLAYYGAYRLRFDGALPPEHVVAFEATVGLAIGATIVALGLFGAYRGAWEYAGLFDAYRVVGAAAVACSVLLVYGEWRVPALAQSHSLLYIYALLVTATLLAARLSFKSLDWLRHRLRVHGHRVLIYGADRGGELTLRELHNHPELGLRPVCFVDEDSRRHGAEIHGVPIVAGFDGLGWAIDRYKIERIVIGTRNLAPEGVGVIQVIARAAGVEVAEVRFGVRWLPRAEVARPAAAAAPLEGNGNGNVNGNGNGVGLGAPVADVRAAG
jgi:UDP-GlcNAc:undecaprenyl-phosphate/decaprenyl-phosphate GlcNAc-1-phosphate transferase